MLAQAVFEQRAEYRTLRPMLVRKSAHSCLATQARKSSGLIA